MANEKIRFDLTASDQTALAFNSILNRLDAVDASIKKTSTSVSGFGSNFRAAIAGASVALVAREFAQLTDTFTSVSARLQNVTFGFQNFKDVQSQLFNISQDNRTSLQSTSDLFSQLARATSDLGVPQKEVLKLTDGIGKALVVSGASGQSASAALMQLAQGFASGALRGQEFVSVQEQAPEILRAVSGGLGITTGELKKMSEEGKLTTQVFIDAFMKGLPKIEAQYKNMPLTIGGANQQIANSFMLLTGEVDKATGASQKIANAISGVAKSISDLSQYQGAIAGIAASLATLTALGLAVANMGALTAAFVALGAFLMSPAGIAVMAVSGLAGIAAWAGSRAKSLKEITFELEAIDARLKNGNMMEQQRNALIEQRRKLLSLIEDESSAESRRLLESGIRPAAKLPKTKEQEAAEKRIAKFLEDQQEQLIKISQGERALTLDQAKRIGLTGKGLDDYMATYDKIVAIKKQDQEIDAISSEFDKIRKDNASDRKKAEEDALKLSEKQIQSGEKALNYLEKYREDMDIILEQIALKNDGIFRTAEEMLVEEERLKLQKKYNETILKIKNLENLTEQGKLNAIAAANIAYEEQLGLVKEIAKKRIDERNDVFGGFKNGVEKFFDEINNLSDLTENATISAMRGMEDQLISFVSTGKASFKDLANSIIQDLIRIQLRQSITQPLAAVMGNLFSPGGYSGMSYTNSNAGTSTGITFDGGGYTGTGARAGGLDGKGGFMAMLHPNETVVDHTKGQDSGGVTIVQNINVTTGVQQTVRAEIMTLMPQIAGAAKAAVADAKLRGGSYAAALR